MMGISEIEGCIWSGEDTRTTQYGARWRIWELTVTLCFSWDPYRGRFLPPGGVTDRMLPAIRGEFRVDVREHDDEMIVVARSARCGKGRCIASDPQPENP